MKRITKMLSIERLALLLLAACLALILVFFMADDASQRDIEVKQPPEVNVQHINDTIVTDKAQSKKGRKTRAVKKVEKTRQRSHLDEIVPAIENQ